MRPPRVAVVAHAGKTLGGGLGELRSVLKARGIDDPLWMEISKGRQATGCAQRALEEGIELLFVWGGDGTVQRCINVMAGSGIPLAIVPAGTANLLARNLELPDTIEESVDAGLNGDRQPIDTGTINGEHFAVMAGAGLDALMIDEADAGLKDRFGRVAYLWTGARSLDASPVRAKVRLEGRPFFKGTITCVLFGNLSGIGAGVELFEGARADDGLLEMGIVTATSRWAWMRTMGRVVAGTAEKSPFVTIARGTSMRIEFDKPTLYELDGGARKKTRALKVKVRPGSTVICMPRVESVESSQRVDSVSGSRA
jgi:diacylglycerol kinase (ATP)